MPITLSSEEKEMIVLGLTMRKNFIETGDPLISAQDVEKLKRTDIPIKALSTSQMQLIINTERLISKIFQV